MKRCICLLSGILLVGCADRVSSVTAEDEATAEGVEQVADNQPAAEPPAGEQPAKPVPITKREAKLVDKAKAMAENPSLVEVENKIDATDPFTAAAQSYFSLGSRAQAAAMKHNIDIMRETNDRWPTFDEFETLMKQSGLKLTALYSYQMYAYDDQTGGISILEDRAEMKRQYEASGRDYPHDD